MRPVSPVLTALSDELALPAQVFGPVENWAFVLLAKRRAGEMERSGSGVKSSSSETWGGALMEAARSCFLRSFCSLRSAARRMDRGDILGLVCEFRGYKLASGGAKTDGAMSYKGGKR